MPARRTFYSRAARARGIREGQTGAALAGSLGYLSLLTGRRYETRRAQWVGWLRQLSRPPPSQPAKELQPSAQAGERHAGRRHARKTPALLVSPSRWRVLRARGASHPVSSFDVHVSILEAARQNDALFNSQMPMSGVSAPWGVVAKVEPGPCLGVAHQEGGAWLLRPGDDPPPPGRVRQR